jgi:hypothetical protein
MYISLLRFARCSYALASSIFTLSQLWERNLFLESSLCSLLSFPRAFL